MARNEQLIRQHKLMQILERTRFGYTLDELRDALVDELGLNSLHTRTLRRDIEALQVAGLDVVSEEVERGRVWKLGATAKATYQINATATELLALSVGRDLLNPLNGTFIGQGITSFWNRVQDAVPDNVWQHYERIRQILFVSGTTAKSYERHQGILKTLERAIIQHRWCHLRYASINQDVSDRKISPRALVFHNASLYVIAEQASAPQTSRHWKLDRVDAAEILDEYFEPDDEDYHEYLETGLGIFGGATANIYEIKLSAAAAIWVEEDPWHPTQSLERRTDSSVLLKVPANHDLEIIPKVLALGEHAEVLTPLSCRESLASIIDGLNARYSQDATKD